jgi:hypothetical protein
MPRPSFRSQVNVAAAAATTLTPPAGHQANDLMIVCIESANEASATWNTAFPSAGWTSIPPGDGGPAGGIGTAAAANATRLTLWWRRAANGTMPVISIADSGDHQTAALIIIQNANTTINPPWEQAANTRQTTNTTTISFNSFTTTNANTLMLHVAGVDTDTTTAQGSAPTNANLSDLTEHVDIFTNTQDGGGVIVLTGGKATAGSTGNTTLTLATTEIFTTWSAAIIGEPDAQPKPWARAVFI